MCSKFLDGEGKERKSKFLSEETTTERSQKQEKAFAKKIGGARTPGSGAFAGHKGDVRNPDFLVECKTTEKKSIRLEREWLEKIDQEALVKQKCPLVHLQFEKTSKKTEKRWVLMPESEWLKLWAAAKEKK